jgi:ribose 5-phosphate isomerase A
VTIIERALQLLPADVCIGLGSGRAAWAFVRELGARMREGGVRPKAVPSSEMTAGLARQEGIPLLSLNDVEALDLMVDGADEVDPRLDLIKGYGRALVREKIVAASSNQLVILVGEEKLVPRLGTRGRLPVEVTPFALPLCLKRLARLGLAAEPCWQEGQLFVSENGNNIVDCKIAPIADAKALERQILEIPGVVGTGLFLEMAQTVLVGDRQSFQLIEEKTRAKAAGPRLSGTIEVAQPDSKPV